MAVASTQQALANGDEATNSPRSWETKGSHKLLAPQTHQRHARIENSVSRERHFKSYTREKGVWSGVGGGTKEED